MQRMDVEAVCVVKVLETSCAFWGGENPQVRVPTQPLCVVRTCGFESARRVVIM